MRREGLVRVVALMMALLLSGFFARTASAQVPLVHVVGWGENLTRIAQRYGVTIQELVTENRLRNPNFIWVGQRLTIPTPVPVPTAIEVPEEVSPSAEVAAAEAPQAQATPMPTEASDALLTDDASETGTPEPDAPRSVDATPTAEAEAIEPLLTEVDQEDDEVQAEGEVEDPLEPIEHVVRAGENLSLIAARYGTTITAIARANNLLNPNLVYAGQKLTIPTGDVADLPVIWQPTSPPAQAQGIQGKWIGVNLSTSRLTAWEGATPVRTVVVSLGLPRTPTLPGRFAVYAKYVSKPMSGPGYYLPNVPHIMYYQGSYAIHGAYWHNNFGQAMSRGCVNLRLPDAEWLYHWTPMGTPVIVHW